MGAITLFNQNADGITSTSATVHAQVTTGYVGSALVYFHWGLADGGNTGGTGAGNWDHVSAGVYGDNRTQSSLTLTGLSPGTVYYVTAYAADTSGNSGYAFEAPATTQSFYFSTPYTPYPDAGAETGSAMDGAYKTPQLEHNWSDPMAPLAYVAHLRTAVVGQVQDGNVINWYAAQAANVSFACRKVGGVNNYNLTFASPGRITFAPTDQSYRAFAQPFASPHVQVKMSVTPQYQGEPSAAEAWVHLRGTWNLVVDVYINPNVPPSDGSTYRIHLKGSPIINNGDPESEFYTTVCGAGWTHIETNVYLRAVPFWLIYVYVEADVDDFTVPATTDPQVVINATATMLSEHILTEDGIPLADETGDVLMVEYL